MSALAHTLGALFLAGVPGYMIGVWIGRRLERRDRRRRIARGHRPRPPRATAREVLREAERIAAGGPRVTRLYDAGSDRDAAAELEGRPAFGDTAAGEWWDR